MTCIRQIDAAEVARALEVAVEGVNERATVGAATRGGEDGIHSMNGHEV